MRGRCGQVIAETLRMMGRLKWRMEREGVWDQTAYNEEMWCAALHGAADVDCPIDCPLDCPLDCPIDLLPLVAH